MRKLSIIFLVVALTLLMISAFVKADNSTDNATINVYAAILETLTVVKTQDMDFGCGTSPSSGAGHVRLIGDGDASNYDYDGYWDDSQAAAATCKVTGQGDHQYYVNIGPQRFPENTETALTTPILLSKLLQVTCLTIDSSTGTDVFVLNSKGVDILIIGGVLSVPQNCAAGSYSGLFEITVSYE